MIDRSKRPTAPLSAALALLLLVATGVSAQHVPGDGAPELPSPGVEAGVHARLFLDFGDTDVMASYQITYENDRAAVGQSLMAGAYQRVHRNLKLGAFYRLGLGQRHDEDWIEPADGEWIWRDTALRPEHTFIADATPRFLLSFLPGEDWVFAVKSRYQFTVYSQDETTMTMQTALIRPGLTRFWIVDREPVLNASVNYATYLSLDFGDNWWYRHGPYANLAYHVTPFLIADLSVGVQWIHWTESQDFLEAWPGNRYAEPVWRPWTVDLGVIYRPRG